MGALFNILSLWASSISSKMNTINSLRLSSQRTNCFRKSGVFLSVRGRNGLSHLQGLVVVVFVCCFFVFFFSPILMCPELLQTNSLQELRLHGAVCACVR